MILSKKQAHGTLYWTSVLTQKQEELESFRTKINNHESLTPQESRDLGSLLFSVNHAIYRLKEATSVLTPPPLISVKVNTRRNWK